MPSGTLILMTVVPVRVAPYNLGYVLPSFECKYAVVEVRMDLIGLNNNNFLRLYRRMMFSPFVTLGGTKG